MKILKLKARIFWGMIVEPIRGGNRRIQMIEISVIPVG